MTRFSLQMLWIHMCAKKTLEKEEARHIFSAALVLCQCMTAFADSAISFPPQPPDLSPDRRPTPLYNFLCWLVDGCDKNFLNSQPEAICLTDKAAYPSPTVHRKVQLLGQDLLSAVSHGREKTPKHIALAMTVKQRQAVHSFDIFKSIRPCNF